jgi:hypothetical protein
VLVVTYITPSKIFNYNIIRGKWVGNYIDGKVILKMNNKTCSLEFKKINSNISETITGNCNVDYAKTPNTLIINNISDINMSLYSLILMKNKNLIHITTFSTKWKLRSTMFTKQNTIMLKKV